MARITVEDCLEKVDNRFKLIHIAAKRVRQLRNGAEPLVDSKNTDIVVALREVAAGNVFGTEDNDDTLYLNDTVSDPTSAMEPEEAADDALKAEKTEDGAASVVE